MEVTASLVKELRERTGAGMMECKKSLVEHGGDIEAAIEAMRKSGQAKAAKKAGRIAAEGVIVLSLQDQRAAMVEVNCETDFVSKGDDFKQFAEAVAKLAVQQSSTEVSDLLDMRLDTGKTVEQTRQDLIAKFGENINLRRVTTLNANCLGSYLHGNRIGVLVNLEAGNTQLAKDIAMHIAASRPICVSSEQIPPAELDKEREIYRAQAAETKKPADIIDKMVEGRMKKYYGEVTLLGQPFIKDPEQTVGQLLKAQHAQVLSFQRFEVGEGIEKKVDNFAQEVMQQVQSNR